MPTALRRFGRFAVVGVIATATHTLVFSLAIELAGIEAVTANAAAFIVAMLVGYALNRHWTFAAHGAENARLWRYFLAALVGLGLNSAIMYVAVHAMHWSPYVGLALALVLVPPLSFALNQFWVFRRRSGNG
jgi:putative flippase GtrA